MSVKLRDLGGTIESNWQENASATTLIALNDLHMRCSLFLFTRTSLISRNDPPNPRYHDGVYVPSFFCCELQSLQFGGSSQSRV